MFLFEWDERKNRTNVLVVVHCYRANDSIIRIISARKATRTEIKQYNERLER